VQRASGIPCSLVISRDNETQTSGASPPRDADVYLLFDIRIETLAPSLPATNAKRLRKGALATKQSILLVSAKLDCFAEPVIGRAFARPGGSQ
jgi:hypothetical protein